MFHLGLSLVWPVQECTLDVSRARSAQTQINLCLWQACSVLFVVFPHPPTVIAGAGYIHELRRRPLPAVCTYVFRQQISSFIDFGRVWGAKSYEVHDITCIVLHILNSLHFSQLLN